MSDITETEWVLGDWDSLQAGDRVCVVWPSGNREGVLFDAGAGNLYLALNDGGNVSSVEGLQGDGGALFVPAPVKPELPTEPGTVIAIGEWWLVRLPSFEGAPSAWELLPFSTMRMTERAKVMGVKSQCVYSDEWVQSEVDQDRNGFTIIASPVAASEVQS